MAVEIIVPLAVFATIFGVVYVIVSAIHKEKMAMIDKGIDPGIFQKKDGTTHGRYNALKFGLMLIGVAIGLFMGYVLAQYMGMTHEVAYFSMIFLFWGISLLLYYLIIKKLKPE